jgi:hypothetical protein
MARLSEQSAKPRKQRTLPGLLPSRKPKNGIVSLQDTPDWHLPIGRANSSAVTRETPGPPDRVGVPGSRFADLLTVKALSELDKTRAWPKPCPSEAMRSSRSVERQRGRFQARPANSLVSV